MRPLLDAVIQFANDDGGGSSWGGFCVNGLRAIWIGWWHITSIPCG